MPVSSSSSSPPSSPSIVALPPNTRRISYSLPSSSSESTARLPQPHTTPIAHFASTPNEHPSGSLIAISPSYIVYAVKNGLVRVIDRRKALRTLLRGHSQRVTDLAFFSSAEFWKSGNGGSGGSGSGGVGGGSPPTGTDVLGTVGGGSVLVWRLFTSTSSGNSGAISGGGGGAMVDGGGGVGAGSSGPPGEIGSEVLLEIRYTPAVRMMWHPHNPNQFVLLEAERGGVVVETTQLVTQKTTSGGGVGGGDGTNVGRGHALCTCGDDGLDLGPAGTLLHHSCFQKPPSSVSNPNLKNSSEEGNGTMSVGVTDVAWSHRDVSYVAMGGASGTVILWEVSTGSQVGMVVDRDAMGGPIDCIAFVHGIDGVGSSTDLSSSSTTSSLWSTEPFLTGIKQNTCLSLWSGFRSDGTPVKTRTFQLLANPNRTVPTTTPKLSSLSPSLPRYIASVCGGVGGPGGAPPYVLLADQGSGRFHVLRMATQTRLLSSPSQSSSSGEPSTVTTALGYDALASFQVVHPILSWTVMTDPVSEDDDQEEEDDLMAKPATASNHTKSHHHPNDGDTATAGRKHDNDPAKKFEISVFCVQSRAVQLLKVKPKMLRRPALDQPDVAAPTKTLPHAPSSAVPLLPNPVVSRDKHEDRSHEATNQVNVMKSNSSNNNNNNNGDSHEQKHVNDMAMEITVKKLLNETTPTLNANHLEYDDEEDDDEEDDEVNDEDATVEEDDEHEDGDNNSNTVLVTFPPPTTSGPPPGLDSKPKEGPFANWLGAITLKNNVNKLETQTVPTLTSVPSPTDKPLTETSVSLTSSNVQVQPSPIEPLKKTTPTFLSPMELMGGSSKKKITEMTSTTPSTNMDAESKMPAIPVSAVLSEKRPTSVAVAPVIPLSGLSNHTNSKTPTPPPTSSTGPLPKVVSSSSMRNSKKNASPIPKRSQGNNNNNNNVESARKKAGGSGTSGVVSPNTPPTAPKLQILRREQPESYKGPPAQYDVEDVVKRAVYAQFKTHDATLIAEVNRTLKTEAKKELVPAVSKVLAEHHKNTLQKIFQEREKTLVKEVVTAVASEVHAPVTAAFHESMREILVPAFEASTQQMFSQISEALTTSLLQAQVRSSSETMKESQNIIDALGSQLTALSLQVSNLSAEVGSLRSQVAAQQQQQQQQNNLNNTTTAQPPPNPTVVLHDEIRSLLAVRDYETAFTKALSVSSPEIALYCCRHADISALCASQPPVLSQPILLCLMQQLGSSVAVAASEAEVWTVAEWLQDIAVSIVPTDESIREHVVGIMKSVTTNVHDRLTLTQGEGVIQDTRLRRNLQVLLQVIRGVM